MSTPARITAFLAGLAVGTRGADHNRSGAYEADFSEQADRRRLTPASAVAAVATATSIMAMNCGSRAFSWTRPNIAVLPLRT